jgi:hypothetical protein
MGMLLVSLLVAYFGAQALFWLVAYIGITNDTENNENNSKVIEK